MRAGSQLLGAASQTVSYFLGGTAILLALAVMTTSTGLAEIADWAWDVLGMSFALLFGSLVFLALFAWVKVNKARQDGWSLQPWLATGLQAANGVATLALTYTLLGIALGIGGLAEQSLTPETVQQVIRGLTENFSLAFMTSVVGLPTSAFLRSLLLIAQAQSDPKVASPETVPQVAAGQGSPS